MPLNSVRLMREERAVQGGVSITDRAHQNREYVRGLLSKKLPEFAAVLDQVVWELTCTGDAPSAQSPP
jgi:hypothetical protein